MNKEEFATVFAINSKEFITSLYDKSQKSGFNLSIIDCFSIMEGLQKDLGLTSKDDFLALCQLLWAKNRAQKAEIEIIFNAFCNNANTNLSIENEKSERINSKKDSTKHPNSEKKSRSLADNNTNDSTTSHKETQKIISQNGSLQKDPILRFYGFSEHGQEGNLNSIPEPLEQSYIKSPYILNEDYLPFSMRQTQQLWRKLNNSFNQKNEAKIDWKATIELLARESFFTKLKFYPKKGNRFQLFFLIDVSGSMVAHYEFGQRLVLAALKSGYFNQSLVFYTHNLPRRYVYKNTSLSQPQSLTEILMQLNTKHTVPVIYSDAGASRGTINPDRISETQKLLTQIKENVKKIVWLNPMPKYRWKHTSAEFIQQMVPMFECTESEIKAAIKFLKT